MKSIILFSLSLSLIVAGSAFAAAPPSGRTFNSLAAQPQASPPNFQKLSKAPAVKPAAAAPDFSKLNRAIAKPAAKPTPDAAAVAEAKIETTAAAVEPTTDTAPAKVAQADLELVGVTQLDVGDAEDLIGPKYRVTIRNNTAVAVTDQFEVTLLASNDDQLSDDLPWNSKWVRGIEAGQTLAVDIRLPFTAMEMNAEAEGDDAAFKFLLIQIDSDENIEETSKENNGGAVERKDVPAAESVASR